MLAAGSRVGDYEIEAELGAGGMARVYRARHAVLETLHALKVLEPEYRVNAAARARFLEEAKIQAKHLDHPGIVKVTNIVATPDHAALVMELVTGGSVEDRLAELRGRPAEVKRIMLAVLDAVGHAHAAGIIHRDLKPANVLLQPKDGVLVPKVTDFGIAKVSAAMAGAGKKSTHGDARMGTLSYMSPEQIRRAKDVTPRSDIFALGVMLYELSTGEVPFGGDSDYDLMESIVNGRYRPPAELDPRIDPVVAAVIARALAPDPAQRFASCADMAAALRGEPPTATAPPARGAGPPSSSRSAARSAGAPSPRRLGLPIGIAVGGAAIAAVVVLVASSSRDHERASGGGGVADGGGAEAVVVDDAGTGVVVTAPVPLPPTCPSAMVLIPASVFWMGSPEGVGSSDEQPRHQVTLAPYCIDRTEVTVAAYAACATCPPASATVEWPELDQAARRLWDRNHACNGDRPDRQDHPVNCVTWAQADGYCRALGKQLPTAAQWELAARGVDGRAYPWGNAAPSATKLNVCDGACSQWLDRRGFGSPTMFKPGDGFATTAPVGSYPEGASPFGVLDLAGNVWEWTADEYGPPYPADPVVDPSPVTTTTADADKRYELRGGGWLSSNAELIRAAYRGWNRPDVRDIVNGFRCVGAPQ